MAKKRAKKTEIKTHKKKAYLDYLSDTRVKTALALIAVIILAILIAFGSRIFRPGNIAAEINGQKITLDELDKEYKKIPSQYRELITKKIYLNQTLIPQTLLVQESDKEGISVSKEETEEFIDTFLNQSGLTKNDLEAQLEQQDISYEEFFEFYTIRLRIVKLLNKTIGVPEVSEDDLKKFYDENKASFVVDSKQVAYAEVKEQIKSYMASQKQQEALVEYIDALRAKSKIKIYFENIEEETPTMGNLDLSGMQQAESTA